MASKTVKQLVQETLELMETDGEWPSPEFEPSPQARRAAAMQESIRKLALAVLQLDRAVKS